MEAYRDLTETFGRIEEAVAEADLIGSRRVSKAANDALVKTYSMVERAAYQGRADQFDAVGWDRCVLNLRECQEDLRDAAMADLGVSRRDRTREPRGSLSDADLESIHQEVASRFDPKQGQQAKDAS